DRCAAEARDPEVASAIGGHPVGYPARTLDSDEPSPVAGQAGADVEVENVDTLGGRVDKVHPAAVGAPRDAVGLGGISDYRLERPIRFHPVERRRMWREVRRSRSREEPPSGVALRVVHPVASDIALDRRGQFETLHGI